MRRLLPALVTGVLVAVLLTPPAHAAVVESARPAAVSSSALAAARAQILKDTNAARARAGLPPLAEDSALDSISQSCSKTQAANSTMAHCSGYHYGYPAGWTWAAENVASGYAVHQVVAGWMGSAGHKANILRSDATHIGIGYATSSSGRTYFTQNFASYPPSVRAGVKPPLPKGVHGYYRAAWSSTIREVRTDGTQSVVTQTRWRQLGSPTVKVAPTQYVKTSWSATRYALITWPSKPFDRSIDQVVVLTASKYSAAGSPRVTTVSHVPTTDYFVWSSHATEVYARTPDGRDWKLSPAQWVAAGSPVARVSKAGFYRAPWSDVIHKVSVSGRVMPISPAQWSAAGSPSVAVAPAVFAQTPWASAVHGILAWPYIDGDIEAVVSGLTSSELARAGSPQVETRTRIPGDSFVQYAADTTVYHLVAGVLTPLTNAQWEAAGSPAPTRYNAP